MATVRPRSFELVTPVSEADHLTGPADAPVVVVEYGDFECPNCKQVAPALKQLLSRHAGKVRLAYRHFPLEGVHQHALQAAEAAEAAGAQGQFWAMHDLLFDNQSRLRSQDLRDYAARLGLDMKRYHREMREHAWLPRVKAQIADGEQSGVRSTPGIFLNGRIHDVSAGLRSLFDATDALLADG
ncbi:MAG TPA: thioredoxin domain-containing protein [Woeseiaceae bacterium]|nr:thioredoxin domain-containing protein [Woeseiaceae bacterium]